MAVLNAVPNSKLLLKSKNLGEEVERQRVENLFQEMGLAPERLELRGHSPSLEEHLAVTTMLTSPLTPSHTPAAPPPPMPCGWACRY